MTLTKIKGIKEPVIFLKDFGKLKKEHLGGGKKLICYVKDCDNERVEESGYCKECRNKVNKRLLNPPKTKVMKDEK